MELAYKGHIESSKTYVESVPELRRDPHVLPGIASRSASERRRSTRRANLPRHNALVDRTPETQSSLDFVSWVPKRVSAPRCLLAVDSWVYAPNVP